MVADQEQELKIRYSLRVDPQATHSEETFRTRLSASLEMVQTWGGMVLKTVIALHSGALVTTAALYTDKDARFTHPYLAELAFAVSIAEIGFGLLAMMAAYLNAGMIQREAEAGIDLAQAQTPAAKEDLDRKLDRAGWRVGASQKAAVALVAISTATFFGSVVLAFRAL